jgi:hypothetical protein
LGGPPCAIDRAPNGFAVDGQLSGQRRYRHNLAHPAAKEGFELPGIERTKQSIEGGRRGRAVLQGQKAFEPRFPGLCPQGKILAGVHVAQAGAEADHQHLPEIVQRPVARQAGVFDFIETIHQAKTHMAHFVRPKDESRPDCSRVYNGRSQAHES